jgi:PAS domain-containing protein
VSSSRQTIPETRRIISPSIEFASAIAIARYLTSVVESPDDAIISEDLNGIITSWNTSAVLLLGYRPDEALGEPVTMLIPGDRASLRVPALA